MSHPRPLISQIAKDSRRLLFRFLAGGSAAMRAICQFPPQAAERKWCAGSSMRAIECIEDNVSIHRTGPRYSSHLQVNAHVFPEGDSVDLRYH